MSKGIVSLCLLAALAVPSAALAQGTTSDSIVTIHGCAAQRKAPVEEFTDFFGQHVSQSASGPMLMIDYENDASKTLQRVEFAYVQGGKVSAVVRDTGRFTPNASIMHAFAVSGNVSVNPETAMTCVPLRALYADGTMWSNPNPPKK